MRGQHRGVTEAQRRRQPCARSKASAGNYVIRSAPWRTGCDGVHYRPCANPTDLIAEQSAAACVRRAAPRARRRWNAPPKQQVTSRQESRAPCADSPADTLRARPLYNIWVEIITRARDERHSVPFPEDQERGPKKKTASCLCPLSPRALLQPLRLLSLCSVHPWQCDTHSQSSLLRRQAVHTCVSSTHWPSSASSEGFEVAPPACCKACARAGSECASVTQSAHNRHNARRIACRIARARALQDV